MLHHLSIPAANPQQVVRVLANLLGGDVSGFGPYHNSYIAWARDAAGTAIEVYPRGTELRPDPAPRQAQFHHNPQHSPYVATHAAISVDRSEEEVLAIAREAGWRALRLSRGSFDVIEFWVENSVMLEILTPAMAADYLRSTRH